MVLIFSFIHIALHFSSKEFPKLDIHKYGSMDFDPVDSAKTERKDQITQKFAKAMWNVLKEYNDKLKVMWCMAFCA